MFLSFVAHMLCAVFIQTLGKAGDLEEAKHAFSEVLEQYPVHCGALCAYATLIK